MKHDIFSRKPERFLLNRSRHCAFFFSLAGLITSLYSSYSHYQVYTDLTYSSLCSLSQAINCDTVAQSPWSIFLGIPLPWWGILGFCSYLFFLMPHDPRTSHPESQRWAIIFFLSLIYCSFSIFLGIISVTQIHSVCIACFVVYTCNFSMMLISWFTLRHITGRGILTFLRNYRWQMVQKRKIAVFFLGMALIIILLRTFLPTYWHYQLIPPDAEIHHGITPDNHPWIGAENPQITIEEFSDYLCFQCAKSHFFLRRLVARYPDKIRLVHRNYPLDHEVNSLIVPEPFHVGSGKLAKLAIYAAGRDKFWEMNDALYAMARKKSREISLDELARKTGLSAAGLAWALQSAGVKELLRRDIWRGMKYGITGTPAFVINGNVYQGSIPPEALRQVIQ